MQFSDELRTRERARSLTFVDFLEALGRTADSIRLVGLVGLCGVEDHAKVDGQNSFSLS